MAEITVDTMQEQDLDDVIALGLATPELHEGNEAVYYEYEELFRFIKSPNDIYLVAKVDGKFAGYRLATFNPFLKEAYLIDMVVKPEYRGMGVSSKLYQKTFEILKEKRCTWVWALVKETNERMMKILDKKGFKKGRKFYFYSKIAPFK